MPLVLLVIAAAVTAVVAAAMTWRWGRATGLALTLALSVILGGGVLLGVLAYLVRGDGELVRWDNSVAEWAQRHASTFSTDVLELVTHLGDPTVVVVLAIVLAAAETALSRSRWVVPFVFLVVAGNGLLTRAVKELADRVRPTLNPIAETLGPSFPSGHSSWAAAFFAAAALLLSRGRGRRMRALISAAAAALVVLVAGTRVLLGLHWLSDVVAGVAVGLAWFCVCAIVFGRQLPSLGRPADEAAGGAGAPPPRPVRVQR